MATEVPSAHRCGVAVFNREEEHFDIEKLRIHGLNVVIFQLVTGRWQWHTVECYISHINTSTIEDVTAAIRDRPYGVKLLVAGYLNANLAYMEGTP